MTDRKEKQRIRKQNQRARDRAGIVHASGHIYAKDMKAFQRLVSKAEADVRRLTDEKKDGLHCEN